MHDRSIQHLRTNYDPRYNVVSLTFGNIVHSKGSTSFCKRLRIDVFGTMNALLTSGTNWSTKHEELCVEYHNKQGTVVMHASPEGNAVRHDVATDKNAYLRGEGFLVRAQYSTRKSVVDSCAIFEFAKVCFKLRKVFVVASSNLPDNTYFEYELCQSWYGATYAEAERAFLEQEIGEPSLTCHAVTRGPLTREQLSLHLLSMLLKVQDFAPIFSSTPGMGITPVAL